MKVVLAVDTNILIRALLGAKVRGLLLREQTRIRFVTTQIAFEELEEHLPSILLPCPKPAKFAHTRLGVSAMH
jgi:predicted nucleic acid-binding protein